MPAPAHQPFSSNSLDLGAPEEAYSRNVCASGTRYEGDFKIDSNHQLTSQSPDILTSVITDRYPHRELGG